MVRIESERLDARNCDAAREKFLALLADRKAVVLDVSAVRYIDCFGFESLLWAIEKCPGKVRLGGVSFGLDSLLRLARLHPFIEHFETVEAAIDRFSISPT